MSGTADPFDSQEFAATLLGEPAAETPPTPAPEPAPAAPPAAEEPTPTGPARDASGRFVPAGQPEPAAEAPPAEQAAPAETPPAETPETPPADQREAELARLREEAAQAKRREETLRGQVTNAQRQAEAAAYQRGLQEQEQRTRQQTWAELDRLAATGQYDEAQIQQAREGYLARWQAEDEARRQDAYRAREADMELGGVALHMDHATVNLQAKGIPSLAQQAGLPEEQVRNFFDDAELARFQRAMGQAKMAKSLGERGVDLGFSPVADRDYLETVWSGLYLAGQVQQAAAAREAQLQAEIDRLTIELNREEAPRAAPETAARGGVRRSQNPDDHATAVLRDHMGDLAALLRTG